MPHCGIRCMHPITWPLTYTRIVVRFEYESHDDSGCWYRAYGNENWEFAETRLMMPRSALEKSYFGFMIHHLHILEFHP
jgi:nuclear transport factor 2 (NTF2) superfamily protein